MSKKGSVDGPRVTVQPVVGGFFATVTAVRTGAGLPVEFHKEAKAATMEAAANTATKMLFNDPHFTGNPQQ